MRSTSVLKNRESVDTPSFGGTETNSSTTTGISGAVSTISNGLCRFNPISTKGKWIFFIQTVVLSFTPIFVLLAQNAVMFRDMIIKKDAVLEKDRLVTAATSLSAFVLDLQRERSAVALSLYMSLKTGNKMDLSGVFSKTDEALERVQWKKFGNEKIFSSKLRFQVKLDDFRAFADARTKNNSNLDANDQDVLDFYNMVTTKVLSSLEQDVSVAQSSSNWRLFLTYFNMIKIIESTGIGLVYGLRFYEKGQLDIKEMIIYVQQNALVMEYYRQTMELVPADIGAELDALYEGEEFKIASSSSEEILANVSIDSDHEKGRFYFEACTKFTSSFSRVLDIISIRIKEQGEADLYDSLISQIWGIFLLCVVIVISPMLIILTRNAITTLQIFATSVEKKAVAMKKQQRKQKRLVYKMLPRMVVDKLNADKDVTETFDSATLYFSSVAYFSDITKACSAMEVVQFLNNLYTVMDQRMDEFDVYKVETISDSYLVASGLPRRNGDRHAIEICAMALRLSTACKSIQRPDAKHKAIEIKAGIHTGAIVAGIVGIKMPRYCLFGDTINLASRMQSCSLPGKIQISAETKMMLDMVGGFHTETRGTLEVKGKGELCTFWLLSRDEGRR